MISLSAPTYDPAGAILIHAVLENPYHAERRGSITATLDGGSYVYDTGYSVSDIDLTCTIKNPTKSLLETLQYLVSHYSQVILSCEIGCYLSV